MQPAKSKSPFRKLFLRHTPAGDVMTLACYVILPPLKHTHGHRIHYGVLCDVIHKTGNTQLILLTCTENFVKFEHAVFEIRERTDIQTPSWQYFALCQGRSNNMIIKRRITK